MSSVRGALARHVDSSSIRNPRPETIRGLAHSSMCGSVLDLRTWAFGFEGSVV